MSTLARSRKARRVRESVAEPAWITRPMIVAVHAALLRDHGGSPGIRDEGLLDSAMHRPRHKWAYGQTDLAALAAAYAFGIARNHPFVDGNKRTAFTVAAMFLGVNAVDLDAGEPEVVDIVTQLAAGRLTEAALASWIRAHTVPL